MQKLVRTISYLLVLPLFAFGMVALVHAESEEAARYMARGNAAMEMARSPDDFRLAVTEYSQAAKAEPGWAEAWFNLGVAQESAGDFGAAIDSFKNYLEKAPAANDQRAVQMRIYGLEYKAELANRQGNTRQEGAQSVIKGMVGKWADRTEIFTAYYDLIATSDHAFELKYEISVLTSTGERVNPRTEIYRIEVSGNSLSGTKYLHIDFKRGCSQDVTIRVDGSIGDDGQTLTFIEEGYQTNSIFCTPMTVRQSSKVYKKE